MSSLKDALARVTRAVRSSGAPRPPPPSKDPRIPAPPPVHTTLGPRERIPLRQLRLLRPHLRGFQKKRYQKFLEPLGMPQLKIYDPSPRVYDAQTAAANVDWRHGSRADIFSNFLRERATFDKLLRVLERNTPPRLMDPHTVADPAALAAALAAEQRQHDAAHVAGTPKFHFHEVPPVPEPLTPLAFHSYIYRLCHLRMLYRNSSSLASGIVPEILLYTHNLDQPQFKHVRSTESYNCLIKFFGYTKYQSSFARELLLVMVKDGHRPNLDTIHQLLRGCRVHSGRRQLVSTFAVVLRYLRLAEKFDLQFSLATWNRVYDCIGNVFLKEKFLNRMLAVNLPVLDNFCGRILADYCTTTADSAAVVAFVELDLRRPNWRQLPRMADKILHHRVSHMKSNDELLPIFTEVLPEIATDAVSGKSLAQAILQNPHFRQKSFLLLCTYLHLRTLGEVHPMVFAYVIEGLCENADGLPTATVAKLVRGLIHDDALHELKLPVETVEYEKELAAKAKDVWVVAGNPRLTLQIPEGAISEHYRIMKRLTQHQLLSLEALVIYCNHIAHDAIKMPWEVLLKSEASEWLDFKAKIASVGDFCVDSERKAADLGLHPDSSVQTPAHVVDSYKKLNMIRMSDSNDVAVAKKLRVGYNASLEAELRARKIMMREPEEIAT